MFPCRDETECQKLVTFYAIYTSIYFSCILFMLYWSNEIYTVGNYNFRNVLLIIAFAEVLKYLSSAVYIKKSYLSLYKKLGNVSLLTFVRGLFAMLKLKEGCKILSAMITMVGIYFLLSVLYGAEIFEKHEETLMFSILLSILTILPVCINLGSFYVIAILFGFKPNDRLENLMYQNLYFTILGAWLGAFVIPLDWERPWQKWPIPCSYGAMIGFLMSHICMVFQLGKMQFKKMKV